MFSALDIARTAIGTAAKAVAKVPIADKHFRLNERLEGPWPAGPFLWLHGASLGECKMLLNLARALQTDIPDCPRILVTTQKAEVLDFLRDACKTGTSSENATASSEIAVSIAPADTPVAMKKFAKSVKPIALVLGENELWPGYLSTMKRLCLKPSVAIVSGRFHAAIPGIDFSPIGFAGMQTGADLSRFMNVASRANIGNPIIGGDWKLLPWARGNKPATNVSINGSAASDTQASEKSVDTFFVSMHFSEWSSLYRMADTATATGEAVVLAPRRLEEVPAFRKAFAEKKIPTVDWPQVQKGAVSIVDKFGLTKDIFAISKTAVVGGSFNRSLGVHDFWEPLQAGVATYVGPYSAGQAENVAALVREGVISQLRTPEEFSRKVVPDTRTVERFLSREKEKIEDSYRQFVDFVLGLLPPPNVKQP